MNPMRTLRLRLKYAVARRRKFVCADTHGQRLCLDTQQADDVGQVLNLRKRILRGEWEPSLLDACFRIIQPGEVLLEIGTWIGPYSVLLARHLGPRGRLVGFEPDPVAFRQCLINLRLNEVYNAQVLPMAISDSSGQLSLYTNRVFGNSGSSILESNPITQGYDRIKVDVPSTTLDRIVAALGLEPTTIKMDIEGAEDLALTGGRDTISRSGVKLLIEIHHVYLARRGKTANTILLMLADMGKQLYFLEEDPRYPYRLMEKMDPARAIDTPIFHVLATA